MARAGAARIRAEEGKAQGTSWGKWLEPASPEAEADSNPVGRAGSWAGALGVGEPGALSLQAGSRGGSETCDWAGTGTSRKN